MILEEREASWSAPVLWRFARRRNVCQISAGTFVANDNMNCYMKTAVPRLPIKLLSGGLLLALVAAGCVTKSQARAQAQAAYLAGQNDALAKMAGQRQGQGIVIVGPVEHPNVPWVEGLTLSQAIATANYTGRHNPKAITITRQGEQAGINPKDLLNGHVVPLEPGDTITIRE
jgi:hypothetical protein